MRAEHAGLAVASFVRVPHSIKREKTCCQNDARLRFPVITRLPTAWEADSPESHSRLESRDSSTGEKTPGAFGNLRAVRTSAFAGGAPSVRPPRVFRLSSVRPTPQGKGAHACTRARRSRERRYARHPPRISNGIRSRASASSFLALPAANADGRRRARARDAGSRTRVRPLRAREARGNDVKPSPRARPRLRDPPAPPRPRARTRKRPAE